MGSGPATPQGSPRVVNVDQARTNLSRLMPLAPLLPQRIPGRLRSQGPLRNPGALLEPMAAEELAIWSSDDAAPSTPQR